jgi:ribosome-binding factor A
MKLDERTREPSLAMSWEECAEDVAVILGKGRRNGDRKENRKAKQLCRQVAETLDLVLSGDCRDEVLQALHVVSVEPAPNSTRLLVTVGADLPTGELDRPAIMALLDRHTGRLRAEVAASIHRKRVPTLAFHVVGCDA